MRELLPVPMQTTIGGDVYSGLRAPRAFRGAGASAPVRAADTVLVFLHPSSNFVGHYALSPCAALGVDAVGVVTRYGGKDSQVILENCVADLGSVIYHLRESEGYRRIVLVGNIVHRRHAIIETVFADLIDGPLAHMPDVILSVRSDHAADLRVSVVEASSR
jgi:hypothetical protein